jgi:hypothetical protein
LTSLFSHKFTFRCFVVSVLRLLLLLLLLLRAHGGEWFCEVGRCVVKTNSMPLLWIPLTKRMAVSDTASWTLCFDANSMPLLQLLLAATGVVTLIVICHRRGFRGDSPGMDLATLDTAMGADGT